MIPFNIPPCVGNEYEYIRQAIDSHKICGDGPFTKKCHAWMEERFGAQKHQPWIWLCFSVIYSRAMK